MSIPHAKAVPKETRIPVGSKETRNREKLSFSFESIEKNEYFNLDGTCSNWASDLFDTLQIVSRININDIFAGKYTGKNSTLRIHQHKDVKNPCKEPQNASLDEMWQIRISASKGGIHGIIVENVFYVIWFDPHHNLYPDENHGGIKKVIPPSTCCKDRDNETLRLKKENKRLRDELKAAEDLLNER